MGNWRKGCLVLVISSIFLAGLFLPGLLGRHRATAADVPIAQVVYGQPNFFSGILHPPGPDTLRNAAALAADAYGGFYVADYGNSRVLHFPGSNNRGNGPGADRIYGQASFIADRPHTSFIGLNYPHGIAVGPDGLYVSDMFNNRILHYPARSTIADRVYGQSTFFERYPNGGGLSASSLYQPQGLALDSTGLYVADSGNNRVLHYPSGSTKADRIYGQGALANFRLSHAGEGQTGLFRPRAVAVDATGLYVADSGNNRVVHYPFKSALADFVYGQADFASRSIFPNRGLRNPDASSLFKPTGIALDGKGGLYVADRNNNRVLYFAPRTKTTHNGPAAIRLYGQTLFTQNNKSTSASGFKGPGDVALNSAGELFVLDIFNQRVLEFAPIAEGRDKKSARIKGESVS